MPLFNEYLQYENKKARPNVLGWHDEQYSFVDNGDRDEQIDLLVIIMNKGCLMRGSLYSFVLFLS